MFLKKNKKTKKTKTKTKTKKQKQKQKKQDKTAPIGSHSQRKSAGVVKQRLYDHGYGTMITFVSFVFFFCGI